MPKLPLIKATLLILISLCLITTNLSGQGMTPPLNITKIYLVEVDNIRDQRMNNFFRRELTKRGFSIATNFEEADAILSGFAGTMVFPKHSPFPDREPNEFAKRSQYYYECQLKSREMKILWATRFDCWTEADESDADRDAVRKMTKQLIKSLQKTARKQSK